MKDIKSIFDRIPSFVWIFIFVGGVILFIGSIIFGFWALATVEGVASIVLLIAALLAANLSSTAKPQMNNIALALIISFFALMGMAIDQTGNVVYNKPIELLCPAGTTMQRRAIVSNPLPGRTDINQSFTCFDAQGTPKERINIFQIMAIRFVEYVFIGYGIYGIKWLRYYWAKKDNEDNRKKE